MFRIIQILSLLLAISGLNSAFKIEIPVESDNKFLDKTKIIGGDPVIIEDYNYIVSIRFEGKHFCGGCIYNSTTILSAGHCFTGILGEPASLSIQAGSSYIGDDSLGQISNVKSVIVNDQFNKPYYLDNDIAMLVLDKELSFSSSIGTIDIAEPDDEIPENTPLEVCGWGVTKSNSRIVSKTLRAVTLKSIGYERCNVMNFGYLNKNNICAGHDKNGKDSCGGDSGGPLVVKKNGKPSLAGIVSWGFGCALARFPGVYTKVSSFNKWIVTR